MCGCVSLWEEGGLCKEVQQQRSKFKIRELTVIFTPLNMNLHLIPSPETTSGVKLNPSPMFALSLVCQATYRQP